MLLELLRDDVLFGGMSVAAMSALIQAGHALLARPAVAQFLYFHQNTCTLWEYGFRITAAAHKSATDAKKPMAPAAHRSGGAEKSAPNQSSKGPTGHFRLKFDEFESVIADTELWLSTLVGNQSNEQSVTYEQLMNICNAAYPANSPAATLSDRLKRDLRTIGQ